MMNIVEGLPDPDGVEAEPDRDSVADGPGESGVPQHRIEHPPTPLETSKGGLGGAIGSAYRSARHRVGALIKTTVPEKAWDGLQESRARMTQLRSHMRMTRYPGMPTLSIVVAAHNTEGYIQAALDSLVRQQWPALEVIVVDDGSTDATADIVSSFCQKDKRFALLRQPQGGPGVARNLGVRQASGKYLAFFDSDDVANPLFYRQAIFSLERTGSDFALGGYDLLDADRRRPPPRYIKDLHRRTRRRITVADVPEAMTNALMCTRVYRRDFYLRQVGPQPEGVFFEDQLVTMRAFVRARRFDLLYETALQWRRRPTGDSTTQRASETENLRQRVGAYREVAAYLDRVGESKLRSERLAQILATDQLTLNQLLVAAPDYLEVVKEFLTWAIAEVGQVAYAQSVAVPDRVLHALIKEADAERVHTFLASGGRSVAQWVFVRGNDGSLTGWFPLWESAGAKDLPMAARIVSTRHAQAIRPGAILDEPTWRQTLAARPILAAKAVIGDDQANPARRQTAMRSWYWRTRPAMRERIFLQCSKGSSATGDLKALADELELRGLGDHVMWAVAGEESWTPLDQTRLPIGSSAYYEALATSPVICVETELPQFFARRSGQFVVRTDRGHPFEAMGLPAWKSLGQSDALIACELARREIWDAVVVPSPLAAQLYAQCYPIGAQIWELGSPRNDRLVEPPRRWRERMRSRWGIKPNQIAVLCQVSASTKGRELDLGWLAQRLGERYVVLGRGSKVKAAPGVIDVTTHLHIDELMVASDIAVFDYSSVRFDYALTDKPMVYWIPALEETFSRTPPLWPYEETTAGPCVRERGALVTAIRNSIQAPGAWATDREALRQRVAPFDDGHAAARLADRVVDYLTLGL